MRLEEGFGMFTEVVVVMLLLLAIVVLDVAALLWGADSRRLDPQSYMAS